MKPYSEDLRTKIIEAIQANEKTQSEIAQDFGVSLSFVEKLRRQWRTRKSFAAKPHAGGRQRVLKNSAKQIRKEVAAQPDATLSELCERVAAAGGVSASQSMMCRELKLLNLPRKKSLSTTLNEIRRE